MNSALKKFLLEFRTQEEFADVFKKAVDGDYESFVTQLKNWAGDPKVLNFLKSGLEDGSKSEDKFSVSQGFIACSQLIPTQSEIDLEKSVKYTLRDPQVLASYVKGGNVTVGDAPIIIFNGKYIIDGHHRWSQVYCINPDAKIRVLNFKKMGLGPEDMLKATQVAIALSTGDIKVNTVEGMDLLTAAPEHIYKYVLHNIHENAYGYLSKTKEGAAKKITMNCIRMQKHNKPIPGAPKRGFMPQTDGNLSTIVKALSSGVTQTVAPFVKTSAIEMSESKKISLKEWDPSMSNDPSAPFNQSDYYELENKLQKLLLKDTERIVDTIDEVPSFSDSDYEKMIMQVDPDGKIWERFENTVKVPAIKSPNFKGDDYDGYENFILPQLYLVYKAAIKAKQQEWSLHEDNNQLNELQSSTVLEKDAIHDKVTNKLLAYGVEPDDNLVNDFIEFNYDLIEPVIDTIEAKDLFKNYKEFIHQKRFAMNDLNESIKKLLKEEDSVEAADPVTMFQDFADLTGQLADIYSTLTTYQTSYIQNPQVQQSVAKMMAGVNQLMKMSTSTMSSIGSSFGLKESDLKKKKVNEGAEEHMQGWSAAQWDNFNRLHPLKKAEVISKLDAPPRGAGKVMTAIKTWAKSNYPGWERVATTPAGKQSVIRQFLKTIPAFKDADEAKIKSTVDEVIKIWK